MAEKWWWKSWVKAVYLLWRRRSWNQFMYIQHDLCQFWCFYHQTHNFFHKSAALSLTLTITHAQARRCGVDVRSRRRCHCTTAATSRVPTTRTSTTRTSGQVLHLDVASPNYPDKYYTEIRTSTTFGRRESQLPGQVLHGNPDKYYIWTPRVPTTRTSTTWMPSAGLSCTSICHYEQWI